ncbi:MAG TPA: hypothetical protein VGI60_14710 [Chthoniobacterales bacterium]|jgi:hypothetical protein
MKTSLLTLLSLCYLAIQSATGAGWQVISSPNGPRGINELHGVSALTENDVWAVGESSDTERVTSVTLVEHWNGTQWLVIPSPNPSSTQNAFNAVAAAAANDVWAVGSASVGPNPILIEHWNGTAWSVVPNPPSSKPITDLTALAVVSANDVWAVGIGTVEDELGTATLHWDGTAWSVVPSPNVVPEVNNTLAGVTAIASNDVWAVGTQQPTSLTDPHTLILHWDGSQWSIVPSPNFGGSTVGNHLVAASGVSSNDVWAVGSSEAGTLTEHWDGSRWSVVATPGNGSEFPIALYGVVALASSNVWNVGEQLACSSCGLSQTLTERWNGRKWAVASSPNVGSDHNELFAVDATPGGTLWTVGTVYHYPKQQTLIQRRLP